MRIIKRMYRLVIVFLFVMSLVGCSYQQQNVCVNKQLVIGRIDPVVINIERDIEVSESFFLSEAFDSVSFVQLSNEPAAIVSSIDEILINDSLIVVLDRYGQGIKLFSNKGTFISSIGCRGRGPGEYVEPTHMDFFNDMIVVWDQFSKRLLYYGTDGNFLFSKDFQYFSLRFHQYDENRIMFNAVNSDNSRQLRDYSIFVCDSLSNVTSVGLYMKHNRYRSAWNRHDFFCKDSTVYYMPVSCDTIYSISSDLSVIPEYFIDFGKDAAPERLRLEKAEREFTKELSNDNYSFLYGAIFLTNDYLYFEYIRENGLHHCLYSTISHEIVSFDGWKYGRHYPLPFCNITTSTNDALVGYFFPALVVPDTSQQTEENLIRIETELGKERADLVKSMKNDDNAIITFFYPSL